MGPGAVGLMEFTGEGCSLRQLQLPAATPPDQLPHVPATNTLGIIQPPVATSNYLEYGFIHLQIMSQTFFTILFDLKWSIINKYKALRNVFPLHKHDNSKNTY